MRHDDAVFPARVLCGLFGWANEQSISPDTLMPGASEGDQRQKLSYDAIRLCFARAARIHRQGDLGCMTGLRKSVHHLGPLGPAQLAQPTLEEAMAYGIRNQLVAGSVLGIAMAIEGQTAAIECHRLFDDDECGPTIDVDHLVTAWSVMSSFCRTPLPLESVELASQDATLMASVSHIMRAPVLPGRPVSRFVFSSEWLQTRNPYFDQMTSRFWREACDHERDRLGVDALLTLRRLLLTDDGRLRSLEEMAREVGVSLRTLHRMMAREGIDYSSVADGHNLRRAQRMLRAGESLDDIAEALGLADARSFRRCFRRWTGMSPSEYRGRSLSWRPPQPALNAT